VSDLQIRTASRDEVETMLDWAAAEGWNPGLDDVDAFVVADREGFLVATVDDTLVACISVVSYGADFGFLGFYICRPEWRGKGYGWAIWQAGIDKLGDRTIGLDGVVEQQANYRKSGFVLAHRNIRFAGPAMGEEIADPHLVALDGNDSRGLGGAVIAYDRAFFPGARDAFLRHWLTAPGRRAIAFVEANAVRGFGAIRKCREGYKIGPLFADTPEIAERLFAALTARHRGETVILDVPEPNAAAVALAGRHGLEPVFETARMYRGTMPELPLDRIYGFTTFELG
jgi:predicted N-acetyltransferase YhbS